MLRDGNPNPVGYFNVRQTVSAPAIAGSPQRDSTRLVFFDAVDPNPAPGKFPEALSVEWTVTPNLAAGLTTPDLPKNLVVTLPKAARPAQTPVIASAGIALSPYQPAPDYSSTTPRKRALWLECDGPAADPADAYFARVLEYGPDPLLAYGPTTTPKDITGEL